MRIKHHLDLIIYCLLFLYPEENVIAQACFASNGSKVFVGTWGHGLFGSIDKGASWNKIGQAFDSDLINYLCYDKEYLFAQTLYQEFCRSADGGINWTKLNSEVWLYDSGPERLSALNGNLYGCIWSDPVSFVYKSTNNGADWISLANGINGRSSAILGLDSTLFVGAFLGRESSLYRSTNDGNSWLPTQLSPDLVEVTSLAGFDTVVFAGTYSGIFRSTDKGASWIGVNTGLGEQIVTALVTCGHDVIAGAQGIFLSTNMGLNWSQIAPEFKNCYIYSLLATDSIIYAAVETFDSEEYIYRTTNNGETWIRSLALVVNDVPSTPDLTLNDFYLAQNFPNPFNPTTTINYRLAKQSYVELKVYDLLGREIQKLVTGNQHPGTFSVNFNATDLPSGIYIYCLQVGSFMQAKKLTVLK